VPAAPASAPGTTRRQRALASWRASLAYHHDFRQLWIGDTISQLGTQLTGLALPVLAIRYLSADEFQMGLLATFEALAFLVIGLPAGAWVDRWRKKRVLIAGDVVRGVALLTLPAAWLLDALTLGHLYVVALTVGVATVFFDVAYQSYLPDLVPTDRIGEGNAKLQASQSVAMVAGPAAGGVLIRVIGAPLTILLDGVSFLGSVIYTVRIRHQETPPPRESRRALRLEVAEGLSFVVRHPLLVRITACTSISNLFGSMTSALIVLFVLRDLGLNEASLGLIFSAGAVGGLLGALTTTRLTRWVGEGRAIPLSALCWAPLATLTPLAAVLPPVPTLVLGSAGASYLIVVYNVTPVSFRQRLGPKPLLGRMNASVRYLVWGPMPLGAFIGGVLGERFGDLPTLWVAVAGMLLAAVPVVFSPLLRMRDLPRELDAHA
jgi:MFS family permease